MKKIGLCLTLLSMIILLSSCQLAKDDVILTPVIEEKDLIGIYLQMFDGSDLNTPLLPLFAEEGAYHFYHIEDEQGGYSYIRTVSGPFVLNLHTNIRILDDTVNGVTTRTQTIDYEFDVMISQEHINDLLYIDTIRMGETMELFGSSGHMISGITMTSTYEDDVILDDVPTHVTYKITFQVIDRLESVKLIEMEEDHGMLLSTTLTEAEESFEVSSNTAYLILEETYEKLDGSSYVVRQIISKDQYVQLNFPNEFGFVTTDAILHIIFPE